MEPASLLSLTACAPEMQLWVEAESVREARLGAPGIFHSVAPPPPGLWPHCVTLRKVLPSLGHYAQDNEKQTPPGTEKQLGLTPLTRSLAWGITLHSS